MENMELIEHEVEPFVNAGVDKIYKQGWKVIDAFNWTVDQIHDQHGIGYHSLAILDVMYPKLKPHEKKLLAMRIPKGETFD
jgi:hypothetical protein